jgi:[ribosomal protein S5]-alanine N-acetyltransferase
MTGDLIVPTIQAARVDLVSVSVAFMRASLEGRVRVAADLLGAALPPDWPVGREQTLRFRLADLTVDPSAQPWLLRAIVLRAEGRMIGHVGFHDPPGPERRVEVGYSVYPEYRRRGYAQEAVEALFTWATREHGITRFRASVSPTNEPSLGLVKKLGFRQTGSQIDELDGLELVFELDRALTASAD